jgi:class 3 adenylate cyclase
LDSKADFFRNLLPGPKLFSLPHQQIHLLLKHLGDALMSTKEFRHKLSAIFSADVVGYSRLMRDDEEATIRTLTEYRKVITDLIHQYRGRIVDAVGDNLLAEFASAVDSIKCAAEIQRELFKQNAGLPENRKMRFRIGLNLGDVVEKDQRIYGDGVNIAARMESLADKGGICISETVYDQVKQKLDFKYNYLGEQKIKNIKEPVRAYWVVSLPGTSVHRFLKAKMSVNKTWRNVILAGAVVFIVGAALAIGNFYVLPKFQVEKSSDQGGKVAFVASEERMALEAIKRREKQLKMELEKKKIAAERKRVDEEKKALEEKKRQEEARKKQLAVIPKAASKSPDDGIFYHKPEGDNRHTLAVFPFCESAIAHTKVIEQKDFTDFMINYTKNIPGIIFTHSYYPYHMHRTKQQLRLINSLIHEGLEKEIWYGDSEFPRKKPDYNILKKLAKTMNSDLILTFKISSTATHPSEIRVTYNGYLVDIEKNIDHEKKEIQYYTERTIGFVDFDIVKKMTKDLFELYLNSNPKISR